MPSICLVYGFVVALGGSARPSGLVVASGTPPGCFAAKADIPGKTHLARAGIIAPATSGEVCASPDLVRRKGRKSPARHTSSWRKGGPVTYAGTPSCDSAGWDRR